MAILISIICKVCKKESSECVGAGRPAPSVCSDCRRTEDDLARRMHFSGLEGLSLEERIRKLEKWTYDYKPPVSIRDIRF